MTDRPMISRLALVAAAVVLLTLYLAIAACSTMGWDTSAPAWSCTQAVATNPYPAWVSDPRPWDGSRPMPEAMTECLARVGR